MTNRSLSTPDDLRTLAFQESGGLLPVVAQDARTGAVLMLAYANREALERTLDLGEMVYFSRSRNGLWHKGATSGNVQRLVSLHADCDGDTVLARVVPAGPACHTEETTCFGALQEADRVGAVDERQDALDRLWATIEARALHLPKGSYTARLLQDRNLRLKKLGEEVTEVVMAAQAEDRAALCSEAADLIFHLLVAMRASGVSLDDVRSELAHRQS